MSEIDRDAFLESLDQLLSESDETVLAAARGIRTQMNDANVTWDMLLVQAPGDDDDEDEYDEDDDDEVDREDTTGFDRASASSKDDLALIEELLTKHKVGDETREELAGYKEDIAEGEFSESDHRYLLALHQRVTGKKR